ncbi:MULTISPECIES: hypothetical protein [unclassified Microcoleus]|uniref:hypothetical protein n=1 Tax=unclassified Microcoleus TaxID=2642155 RepID=UPI001DBCD9B3|nr:MULTISPECIES: hypothetical protein [unclassified Microcoleus]MCC3545651.1 hypothetical protein [Microcoleus sp. PH2017_24_DOB_U_A]
MQRLAAKKVAFNYITVRLKSNSATDGLHEISDKISGFDIIFGKLAFIKGS